MSRIWIVAAALLGTAAFAEAQPLDRRVQVGVQFVTVSSGEYDVREAGLGGRLSWQLSPLIGVEGEVNAFSGDADNGPVFSGGRTEALFDVTLGPRLGRLRPFARARYGRLAIKEAPEPFACVAIFPPPLACTLASGVNVAAFDIGGGVEVSTTDRTFLRVDLGDRALRYSGSRIGGGGAVTDEHFVSHEFRVALGGGVRF